MMNEGIKEYYHEVEWRIRIGAMNKAEGFRSFTKYVDFSRNVGVINEVEAGELQMWGVKKILDI